MLPKKAYLGLVSFFCTLLPLHAADFHPFDGPKPIAIFIQTEPWAMVLGADTPRVAVYEDGEVIFVRTVKNRETYFHKKLDAAAFEAFRRHFQPLLDLKMLKADYDIAPGVTDQPRAMLYLRQGDYEVTTTVRGLTATGSKFPFLVNKPDVVPAALLELHKFLAELDLPGSQEWVSRYVEVTLWDYGYAPDESIHWPKDWPSLHSDRAVRHGNSYSIFLNGSSIPRLKEFLADRNERGAIEIDGKKMMASARYVFPSEPVWKRALQARGHRSGRQWASSDGQACRNAVFSTVTQNNAPRLKTICRKSSSLAATGNSLPQPKTLCRDSA